MVKNKLQLSRSAHIEESRAIAVLRLDEYEFVKGEPVVISYYKTPDVRNNIGTLVAVGIKDGNGRDCYRIVDGGGTVPVRLVSKELPDVSKLVHGEICIWHDVENNTWNYVTGQDPRTITPITGGPFIFYELETGYRWFYNNQDCKREDDFLGTDRFNAIISLITDLELELRATSQKGYFFEVGMELDLPIKAQVINKRTEQDITDQCEFYFNKVKVELVNGEHEVEGVNSTRSIEVRARYYISEGIHVTVEKEVGIVFGLPVYFGPYSSNTWDNPGSIEKVLRNVIVVPSGHEIGCSNITLSEQNFAIAIPKDFTRVLHIYDDHGIDYINNYKRFESSQDIIRDVPYVVYIKTDKVTIRGFKQRFTFEDTQVESERNINISEILSYWKNKNTADGIVTVGSDGKIDLNLLPENIGSKKGGENIIHFVRGLVSDTLEISRPQVGHTYLIHNRGNTPRLYNITSVDESDTTSFNGSYSKIEEESALFVVDDQSKVYRWSRESNIVESLFSSSLAKIHEGPKSLKEWIGR